MTTVRRPKWQPQPPQTPRILHLPRRTSRRKMPTKNFTTKSNSETNPFLLRPQKGKLESLFDQERAFSYTFSPVILHERGKNVNLAENEEHQWRFQADMLRAECNFLRVEREVAVKKLERERVVLEKSLKFAVNTLNSGKKKIRDGESGNLVLEEEIEELAKKLIELQRSCKVKSPELHSCSNFDKKTAVLQKKLEKYSEMQDECCVKDITEVSAVSLPINSTRDGKIKSHKSSRRSTRFTDVETLKRKMERLSKGKLLKRMEEEYGYMLSSIANYSIPSSASTSRRCDLSESSSSFAFQQPSQKAKSGELKPCSGRCKAIVKRILEQVKAETEQWSQMQEMLGQVRAEMEEMQASRDFWEEQVLVSEQQIQTLQSDVEEWEKKAHSLETKENQLNKQVQELQQEIDKLQAEKNSVHEVKDIAPISLGAQLAREKRMLMCRVKGNTTLTSENAEKREIDYIEEKKTVQKNDSRGSLNNRYPFKEISNMSPLVRQNSRRYVYPLHSRNYY